MFKSWDFERTLLAVLVVMILGAVGFILWQRSVADNLRGSLVASENKLTKIGELSAEVFRLQLEMEADNIASGKIAPLAYIEEQEQSSRIGKKFTTNKAVEPHPSEGFEDTRFTLGTAQGDYDFTRNEIANFLLHIEGNTTRMKATRIKLDLSTRKNAEKDYWKPAFTLTDRMPIGKG